MQVLRARGSHHASEPGLIATTGTACARDETWLVLGLQWQLKVRPECDDARARFDALHQVGLILVTVVRICLRDQPLERKQRVFRRSNA